MNRQFDPHFECNILPPNPDTSQLQKIVTDYQAIVLSNLQVIIDRCERQPDYHWIDTKLNLITGKDFAVSDPLRGTETVYAWIQGRALEALAGHALWLHHYKNNKEIALLINRIEKILRQVL